MEMTSRWRDRGVLIDGKDVNWFSSSVPVDGEQTAVVVCNDSEYVYVGLRTTNRDLGRLVVREGITWWFDREGGGKKRFGVHYPVGAGPNGRLPEEVGDRGRSSPEMEGSEFRRSADELDLYVSGEKQSQRMTKLEAAGIDARFRQSRDTLYYELVVPLAESASHPFAIGTTPGTAIGIGAETARERPHAASAGGNPERASQPHGGGRSGMGGGGGRAGREGGTVDRQQGSPRPDPLNVWAKVHLAGPSSPVR